MDNQQKPVAQKKAKAKVVKINFNPKLPFFEQGREILNLLIPYAPDKVKEHLVPARDLCSQKEHDNLKKKMEAINKEDDQIK